MIDYSKKLQNQIIDLDQIIEKNKVYRLFDKTVAKKCYFQQKSRCEFIEIIRFINNKTNKTNMEKDSKIDKDEYCY